MKNGMIVFAAVAVVIVACNHESAPAKGVTTTGAGVVANDDAVRQLTDARCDRAKACNELGPNQKYPDHDACKREVGHDLNADLRPGECPRGIREQRVGNCLQEIQNEKCGNFFDKISRNETCRTGKLCLPD